MSLTALLQELPSQHQKHLDPASPAPMRMMAAKGLAPVPPREMVLLLCGFCYDADPQLASAAREAFGRLPERILGPALDADLPSAALNILASLLHERDDLLERVVLNRKTPDHSLASLASDCSERIVELLAGNQERCLRSKEIVVGIGENPHLSTVARNRLFDFLVRAGILYEEMPEFREAYLRLGQELPEALKEDIPIEIDEVVFDASLEAADEFPSDYLEDLDESAGRERIPVLKLVATLTPGQKVALASKGNKEVRNILIRDRNKSVATAALKNPRITEREIIAAANNRSISEEVIRLIAAEKEYLSVYAVKIALVNNPKTPLGTSMRLLPFLRKHDIKHVSNSRGIPGALVNQAKRLLKERS